MCHTRFAEWLNGLPDTPLSVDTAHIIRIGLDEPDSESLAFALLSEEEQQRTDGFVRPVDRRRYAIAHAGLRVVLGRILGQPPGCIRFVADRHGKPSIADDSTNVHFSLSHSGGQALAAIVLRRRIGIDIEERREIDAFDLATRFFSPFERVTLAAVPTERVTDSFFRCWTRKEAFVKALGIGLTYPLDRFSVSIENTTTNLLLDCEEDPTLVERWHIVDVAVPDNCFAALAIEGGAVSSIQYWAPATIRSLLAVHARDARGI